MNIHYFVWQIGLLWNIKHPVFRGWRRWKQLYLLCSLRVFPKQPKAPARFSLGDPNSTDPGSSPWGGCDQHVYLHSHLAEAGPICLSPGCLSQLLGPSVVLLFYSASPTQRTQKAPGQQRAQTLLGMLSWKASWGGEVTSVLHFSVVPSRNQGNLMVFYLILVRSSALAMAKTQFRCNY